MKRLLVLLLMLWAGQAEAVTYYTAKTGSDANTCTQAQSTSTPKLTIAGGISCLAGGGDTLFVRAGTYAENINSGVPSGTSWSSYVRIAAFFPESVTLKPSGGSYALSFTANESYIEWDGINLDAENVAWDNFRVEYWASGSPHHIRLKNATLYGTLTNNGTESTQPQMAFLSNTQTTHTGGNEIINCTFLRGPGNRDFAHAIYVSSSDNIVSGNDVSTFLGAGIQVYNGSGQSADNNVVKDNIIHDWDINSGFRGWGIIVAGTGNQVFNNIIYDIEAVTGASSGIDVFSGNAVIYNNTVYSNAGYGVILEASASNAIVRNNILFSNGTNYSNSGTGTTESNNLTTDPSFIDAAARDFRLQNSSAAKDTGTNAGSIATIVLVDRIGTTRPQNGTYDIGAYEYFSPPADVPATGTIVVSDMFTDMPDVALVSHTGETGATWAIQTGSSAGMVITDANRLRINTPDVDTFAYASGSPISSQYDSRIEFRPITTVADHTVLLWARMSTAERTGYFAIYNRAPATMELWVVLANVYTLLGQCAITFTAGTDYTIALEVRTGTQQLWYWPTSTPTSLTQCATTTDTSITATGKGGIALYAPTAGATNSTGFHIDKYVLQDVNTSGTPVMCTKCRIRSVQ